MLETAILIYVWLEVEFITVIICCNNFGNNRLMVCKYQRTMSRFMQKVKLKSNNVVHNYMEYLVHCPLFGQSDYFNNGHSTKSN